MTLRRLALVLVSLVALALIVDALLGRVSLQDQKPRIEARLGDAIGLPVRIEGAVRVHVFPGLKVEAHDVVVENPPDRPSPELLRVGRIELGLNLWRLLQRRVEIRSLHLAGAIVHLEPDAAGELALPLSIEETPKGEPGEREAVRIRSIDLEDVAFFYRRSEQHDVISAHVDRLLLHADHLDDRIGLQLRARYDGGELDLSGLLGTPRELRQTTRPWPVDVKGTLLASRIAIDGAIAAPTALEGVDLGFVVRVPDFGARLRETGHAVPRVGAVRAEGRLTRKGGVLGLSQLQLSTLERKQVNASVRGAIGDLRQFRGVALDVELASDLSLLQPLLAQQLPPGIGLTAQARIEDQDGTLGIRGRARASDESQDVVLTLEGAHGDLSRIADVEADVELQAVDLPALARVLGLDTELPAIGPVKAHAKVHDRDGAFGLRGIVVRLGTLKDLWLHIDGDVNDVARLGGVLMTARFGDPDTSDTRLLPRVDLSALGSLVGEAVVTDRDGTLGVERIELQAGRGDAVRLLLKGGFDDLRETDEIELDVSLQARDLHELGTILEADLPAIGPLSFEGRVTGSNEALRSRGTARLDQTVLEGEWLASFATGTQPRVEAKLRSSRVRLRDLGLSESAKPPARVASPAAQRGGKSAGGEIDPEPLRKLDADVSLQVDQITGVGESRLENVTLAIKLDSGLLAVNGYAVGGTPDDPSRYDLAFTLDARSRSPSYELHLEGSQVDIAEWMRQLQVEGKSSGVADVLLDLRTRGRKRAEMRANLDGYAGMSLRGAYLVSATMRRFVVNIARVAFPTIRSSEVESSPVSCLRGEFDVERGVASVRELLLQGPSESVSGSGRIDLGGNAYDLTFTPHSRNPALIGVAATVRVTGPLQDPKISAVPRSLATSAARGILANAMRPARAVLSPIRSSDPERIDACARPLLRNADAASR